MNRWLVRLLLAVPALVLLYFPAAAQARVWFASEPDVTLYWQDAAASTEPVACGRVDLMPDITVEPATNAHALTRVSLDEANATAQRVAAAYHGWPFFRYAIYGEGPELVYLTLPDADEPALAWARTQIWDDDGNADLVFLDARTGDPLLLVTGISIRDAAATCRWASGEFERVVDPLLSMIGFAIYMLLLFAIWALRRAWRIYRGGV